jgi:exopolyphosphatase / guanosine-5'-triphosphate,3'-diphosphate pyrophosphatase
VNSLSPARAAVVDIGSNSIKILVAELVPEGGLRAVLNKTIEARISAGISRAQPRLGEEGMSRGVDAVRELVAAAAALRPGAIALVATSAVRDAVNGAEFCERIRMAVGHSVRILSGDEEAGLIGRGLTCDPALSGQRDFYVFDLGGGSLECLAFRDRRPEQRVSLPLGCVRLTEIFVADPSQPFGSGEAAAVAAHVHEVVSQSGFAFSLPTGCAAVGTGGTLAAVRGIQAAAAGAQQSDPIILVSSLRVLLREVGGMPLAPRQAVAGLPPPRADVFPTALATFIALAEIGKFEAFVNSLYNLRWGLAAELLEGITDAVSKPPSVP